MSVHRGGTWIQGIEQVDFLVEELKRVPKESKRNVRKAVIEATSDMRRDMQARASWSSRIPGAISNRVAFSRGTVEIRVNKTKAPHARPYEGVGGNRTFRHPVYGNTEVWVSEATRPFFFPAVRGHRKQLIDDIETAVFKALPRM